MNWLLWREARQNQIILYTGIVLLVIPYLLGLVILLLFESSIALVIEKFRTGLVDCSVFSLSLSQLTIVLLAGNAFAGERADRSAEFIACLPLKRTQLLTSKLCLLLIALAVIWGVNLFFALIGAPVARSFIESGMFAQVAITGLVLFGVAWLISSLQSSPTFAVGGGIVTPLIVSMTLLLIVERIGVEDPNKLFGIGFFTISTVIGIVSFGIGTAYYLQRKEP
ncbi:MAG: hypothetical protein ACKVH8_04570 [Pirellulales bacterium]|jgi:ABC-type transport system involved in multi-copper enzyme maturation permease subunit